MAKNKHLKHLWRNFFNLLKSYLLFTNSDDSWYIKEHIKTKQLKSRVERALALYSSKLHFCLFIFNSKYYQNEIWSNILSKSNLVKYQCILQQTFLTCFWFNAGGWKLVPGPYDNITIDDNRSVNFQQMIFTIFNSLLFMLSKM